MEAFFETLHMGFAICFGVLFVLVLACAVYFNLLDKSEKTGKGDSPGACLGKFVLAIIIVLVFFFIMGMCGGDNATWSSRHT